MSSRADRLASRFADLAQPVPETADGTQQTVRSQERSDTRPDPASRSQGWDATHRRVTYWMHVDVIEGVRRAAERNGESAASFVDRALRAELQRQDRPT